jgi:hypothetical protein
MATTQAELLRNAIDDANLKRLRAVLHNICEESDHARQLVSDKLLVNNANDVAGDVEGDQARHKRQRTSGEFTRQRFEKCCQCEVEFDVLTNSDGACTWHDGTL